MNPNVSRILVVASLLTLSACGPDISPESEIQPTDEFTAVLSPNSADDLAVEEQAAGTLHLAKCALGIVSTSCTTASVRAHPTGRWLYFSAKAGVCGGWFRVYDVANGK